MKIRPEDASDFRTDGVICVRNALGLETLRAAREAFDWSLEHPGPGYLSNPFGEGENAGTFEQDLANPAALDIYPELIERPEFSELLEALWGHNDVCFMYEQVFRRSGGATRRTSWHQDTSYLPVIGSELANVWIPFESLAQDACLEVVRGSHRGVLYDTSAFDADDPTEPVEGSDGSLPRLPDIESQRDQWPIVSWAVEPGDVIVMHPSALHGGGSTESGGARCTLSLRFFGRDAVVAKRSLVMPSLAALDEDSPRFHPLSAMFVAPEGTPFQHPRFPKLHPERP